MERDESFAPIEKDEALALLGDRLVRACERRGIDLENLNWNEWARYRDGKLDPLVWYPPIRAMAPDNFSELLLPNVAHLIKFIAAGGDPDSHIRELRNIVESRCNDPYYASHPAALRHFEITIRLLTRIAIAMIEEGAVRDIHEPMMNLYFAINACLEVVG